MLTLHQQKQKEIQLANKNKLSVRKTNNGKHVATWHCACRFFYPAQLSVEGISKLHIILIS